MTSYEQLISRKEYRRLETGFDVAGGWKHLSPFQQYCVKKALKAGRFALIEDCGLGKTRQQITWADEVAKHTGGPVLILAPLAVVEQTITEGKTIGLAVTNYFDVQDHPCGIYTTNYDQLENVDVSLLSGIVLDESSILKNFSGATRNLLVDLFKDTPFKLCCTATPSPNDELEIGNHAEFLNVMTSQDMRAMFFTTDKEIIKGNKYRLKAHAEKIFYRWMSTWALMISKPSDIGYSDEGYVLPPLYFIDRQIVTAKKDNGLLFNDVHVSATGHNTELKLTTAERMACAAELVNGNIEQWIVWVAHDEEGELLRKLIPDAVEVKGSDKSDIKKKNLLGFANNEFRVLITKGKIASMGLNYQNCQHQLFTSPDFSFEKLYQSVRRSYRFGQLKPVWVYSLTTDTMQNVSLSLRIKEAKFLNMQAQMRAAMLEYWNAEEPEEPAEDVVTDNYTLINGDCITEIYNRIPDNSIDYSFFSPPFGAMYVFSNDPRDFSNVKDNDEMYDHFRFLTPQLYRVLKPGRLISMHIMQSTTLLGRDGHYSIKDFRGDLIRLFQDAGFYFHAEVMIRKDPKTAAIRTKNRQLMHGTTKQDSSIVRPGLADYIITFRKPGENEEPIKNDLPFDLWCKIAEPVWIDIEEGDTVRYMDAKDTKDERHITPTQLEPIRRCYLMWTNKGDTVLSPMAGVGSEGKVAIEMDRKAILIELKKSYFGKQVGIMASAQQAKGQLTLL